jgi:hypothetical protein
MIPYCASTGTKTTLADLRTRGWRLLISAGGSWNHHGFQYAADNGAWKAWQEFKAGKRATPEPDLSRFQALVQRLGGGADFIVIPDIVAGGLSSWALTRHWLRELRRDCRLRQVKLLMAVQDGMTPDLVQRFVCERIGLFVGGSTEWKLATLRTWAELARRRDAWCHVGRVNTARRIRACEEAGVTSWDGASAALFPKTLPFLDRERRKLSLVGEAARRAAALSPEEFARRSQMIIATQRGHARHRAFDKLCEDVLRAAGYGHGVRIFEAAVASWHAPQHRYPYPDTCPDCESGQVVRTAWSDAAR